MPIPNYLKENEKRITNIEQQAFRWSNNYNIQDDKSYSEHGRDAIKELSQRFPNHSLSRNDVVKLFKNHETYYLGFVAAMIWGGINVARGHFRSALEHSQSVIESIITDIKSSFQANSEDETKKIFLSMCPNQKNRIKGIGPSYFTKLFFFVGQADDKITIKPLILDKWTINAFGAMLLELGERNLFNQFFTQNINIQGTDKINIISLKNSNDIKAKAYWNFIRIFNEWATEMALHVNKLEEFVFGTALNRDTTEMNPRRQISAIIEKYF